MQIVDECRGVTKLFQQREQALQIEKNPEMRIVQGRLLEYLLFSFSMGAFSAEKSRRVLQLPRDEHSVGCGVHNNRVSSHSHT